MSIFSIILFIAIIAAAPYLIYKHIITTIEGKTARIMLTAVTIITFLVAEVIFISAVALPRSIDKAIGKSISKIEAQMNEISPGFTDQVQDVDKVKAVLSDSNQVSSYLESNPDVNFIMNAIGVTAYVYFFDEFSENIETNLIIFEQEGKEFTISNIFEYIHQNSKPSIMKGSKILQIIIIVLILIGYIALVIISFAVKKNLHDNNNSIIINEEPQKEE